VFGGQGIIGNDGRHYILDLLRTFPPDVNFLPGIVGPIANLKGLIFSRVCLSVSASLTGTSTIHR